MQFSRHDDTSGYDSRCCSAPSLARASPPDSKINNTPFPHTNCQPQVPTAATPGTYRHLATAHAPQNQISPQLILSVSESLTAVAVIVLTRATITVQPNLANWLHIARSYSKLPNIC